MTIDSTIVGRAIEPSKSRDASGSAARSRSRGGFTAVIELIARHRVISAIVFLALMPLWVPFNALVTNILIYGLFASGYNLVFGYAGMLALGHAALFGAGAYAAAIALVALGLPWWVALLMAVAAGSAVAFCMGGLATRTRGIYFGMVTLALGECMYFLCFHASGLTGGDNGYRGINLSEVNLLGIHLDLLQPHDMFIFVCTWVALALALLSRVLHSPFGCALQAIRENEGRARACGIPVARVRLAAFTISGAVCGLAGALSAINLTTIGIESLSYHASGQVLMMTLLGGMGTFFGPFVGAGVFLMLEHVITGFTSHWQLFAGCLFIVLVIFFPKGIWGTFSHWSRS